MEMGASRWPPCVGAGLKRVVFDELVGAVCQSALAHPSVVQSRAGNYV